MNDDKLRTACLTVQPATEGPYLLRRWNAREQNYQYAGETADGQVRVFGRLENAKTFETPSLARHWKNDRPTFWPYEVSTVSENDPAAIEAMLDAAHGEPLSEEQVERMLRKAKGELPVGRSLPPEDEDEPEGEGEQERGHGNTGDIGRGPELLGANLPRFAGREP